MEVKQLEEFLRSTLVHHKRIIKPWKKALNPYEDEIENDYENRYSNGWNDCLKEVEKNHKDFMKHLEDFIKEHGD